MFLTHEIINPVPYSSPYKSPRHSASYRVYMLRVWRENSSSSGSLRLTLEDTRTGDRVGFTNWEKLATYLEEKIEERHIGHLTIGKETEHLVSGFE